jgi:hypothetical protein
MTLRRSSPAAAPGSAEAAEPPECCCACVCGLVSDLAAPSLILPKVDNEAALKSWKVYEKFSTVEKCDKSLSSAQSKYGQTAVAPTDDVERGTLAFALQMVFARCVSSDDLPLAK